MSKLDWIFRSKFRKVAGYDLPSRNGGVETSRYCMNCGMLIRIAAPEAELMEKAYSLSGKYRLSLCDTVCGSR